MADYPTIVPGLDAVALGHDMTNAEAHVQVNEAQVASTVGMHVFAETAPNVLTYPVLKQFQWREIDGTGIETGNRYYWNGIAWTLERPPAGVISGDSFAEESIPVSKLSGVGAQPFYIIQRNGSNTGWMIVSVPSAIPDGGVQNIKLQNAPNADYIKYSLAGGVYGDSLFQTIWDTYLDVSNFTYDQIQDTANTALPNQLLYFKTTGGQAFVGYPEEIMRVNTLLTNRIKYPAGSAGKYPRVNTGQTDVDFVAAFSTAILKDVQPNGTDGLSIASGSAQKVRLNTEIDPAGFVTFNDAADTFSLEAGTYEFDIMVPFYQSSVSPKCTLILVNESDAVDEATASVRGDGDQDAMTGVLKHVLTITSAKTYSVKIHPSANGFVGKALSLGYSETYTQIAIRRIG